MIMYTLQHAALRCNILQHTAIHCNTLQHNTMCPGRVRRQVEYYDRKFIWVYTFCNTLQYTATRSNTLQHAATRCNTLRHTTIYPGRVWRQRRVLYSWVYMSVTSATHCNTLQHAATRCITLHHTASHCDTIQYVLQGSEGNDDFYNRQYI